MVDLFNERVEPTAGLTEPFAKPAEKEKEDRQRQRTRKPPATSPEPEPVEEEIEAPRHEVDSLA
jgi:hypothetical protein